MNHKKKSYPIIDKLHMAKDNVMKEQLADDSSIKPFLYKASNWLPEWLLSNKDFKGKSLSHDKDKSQKTSNVFDVFLIDAYERTVVENDMIIHWLVSNWHMAKTMSRKMLDVLMRALQVEIHEEGENIITEGETGNTFYIIIAGKVDVMKDGRVIAHMGPGQSFGEIALTNADAIRTATIRAQKQVEVAVLNKKIFDNYVKKGLLEEYQKNVEILRDCALFRCWPRSQLEMIANKGIRRSYKPDDIILRQVSLVLIRSKYNTIYCKMYL